MRTERVPRHELARMNSDGKCEPFLTEEKQHRIISEKKIKWCLNFSVTLSPIDSFSFDIVNKWDQKHVSTICLYFLNHFVVSLPHLDLEWRMHWKSLVLVLGISTWILIKHYPMSTFPKAVVNFWNRSLSC